MLLLAAVWAGSVAGLFVSVPMLDHVTGVGLLIFVLLTLSKSRRETKMLMLGGAAITAALLATVAGPEDALRGLERSLIFAGLLPTLQMTKAVALRMPSVHESQNRLAALPGKAADVGIAIGTTVFGSVLNTGAFALVSAVIKPDATEERRLAGARAAMRGMNISVLWSPFFVGFAVAGTYLPTVPLWQIVPFGFFCVCLSIAIALAMFARPFSFGAVRDSLACLGPIAPRLGLAAGTVILVGALTPLSTLGAIIVVMPVLCAIQFQRHPEQIMPVFEETAGAMSRMGDDLALIVVAMVVGTAAGEADALITHVAPLLEGGLPVPLLLAAMIGIQLLPAIVGIHPIITGTIFIAALTSLPHGVLPLALYEAMLAGWGLGSMISIASLSVVTSGSMFGVRPLKVAFGPNLIYVMVVWAVLVPLLSAVHYALS
ncbi:hypothetical protein NUH88_17530 [Nisaea acidiphila]|uniref:DUF401 family protein n=1 Tax=Nisaea acidiphila TaxID=1862145 RepID=A0A9J7AQN4_9PROT|nr:hypothetical protein [Nisaea acidiphila]UUX49194.1 hypothetical protein NUH88_17530 [Nisaea acidiphila]